MLVAPVAGAHAAIQTFGRARPQRTETRPRAAHVTGRVYIEHHLALENLAVIWLGRATVPRDRWIALLVVSVLALAGCGEQSQAEKAATFCKERMADKTELTHEQRVSIVEECERQALQRQTVEETDRYKREHGATK
jgi:hypothetical protein